MSFIQEYRKSLKMAEAEEVLDLVFYRPLALIFVKAVYRLPITPNQVTLLSLFSGLASAYSFALGTTRGFAWGGIWYMIANILDCGDGQLARLQNSGTPLGRLVDGIVDWIISTAIFIGLGIGLAAHTGTPAMWYLAIAGGITSALHAILFDSHQQEFISMSRGEPDFLQREVDRTRTVLQETPSTDTFRRLALRAYLVYMGLQARSQAGGKNLPMPAELYRTMNLKLMRWYTFIGATTNRSLLIVTALFSAPEIFLWLVITAGNVWLAVALVWKRRVHERMAASLRPSPVPSNNSLPANV